MAVVAGLFDSEADADKAMDRLLRENIKGLDTRVINGSSKTDTSERGDIRIPFIPNTSGGPTQTGVGPGMTAVGPIPGDWLGDMDKVEEQFYRDALREGSTLALAKVPDEQANQVRLIFRTFGARTYQKD
jgi:hypothetical protein